MIRRCAFAGSFYPQSRGAIEKFIDDSEKAADLKQDVGGAFAYVAPHAGYAYSGKTAAYTYKALSRNGRIENIDTIVLVGPNHTGYGTPISVSAYDWSTPLGIVPNDLEFSRALAKESSRISMDETAHGDEHSIEVQLPFLQRLVPGKKFSFICMGNQSLDSSLLLSSAIVSAAKKLNRQLLVIASSDFDHYEEAKAAEAKDTKLLEAIKALDYTRFNELVAELDDSACGFGPITVAMSFAKSQGASKGVVLKYSNSGDETGDYSSVVAYASIAFTK